MIAAAVFTACGGDSGGSSTTTSTTPPLGGAQCSSGNDLTFINNNSYPIWLGEGYQGAGNLNANIIEPPNNNWKMTPGSTVQLCIPSGWSGRFWPRTECQFGTLFSNDPGYTACTSTSQCGSGHLCYGGKCMLDCTTGGASFCTGTTGLNNSNAICVSSQFTGGANFCTYPQGTVCKTGDCQGLYQCYGQWGGNQALYGAAGPVSLFEPTSNGPTNVNYDVSLVSGYNNQMLVTPSSSACFAPGCTTDLDSSCPANLQVTEAPTTLAGPIPCGSGTFCQSGVCQNNNTCVIGCNDPSDQCETANPPAGLDCNTVVPLGDGSTYADMYFAKNNSGNNPSGVGDTMISGNQGNATCWGTADCLPNETCSTTLISSFPAGVGVCVPTSGSLQPQIDCATQTDVGNACGGYVSNGFTGGIGYTCVSTGIGSTDVACVPPYNPPVSGLGNLVTNSGATSTFFSGTASPLNPEWVTAATQAGGGTTPWYETFTAACPNTYGWQYDDHSGGFDCNTGSGGANVNMTINFGPTPTPSP